MFLVKKGTVKIGGKSTNNIDVWNFKDESELDRKKQEFGRGNK